MLDNQIWLDQVQEDIIEPERKIIDPHHHLWEHEPFPYRLEDLWRDTDSGHNIVKTVFIECNSSYWQDGKDYLRPVGETEYVVKQAARAKKATNKALICGIVAFADLTSPHLDEILDAHQNIGGALFKGIRHAGAYDPQKETLSILNSQPAGLFSQENFRQGVRRLGERGLSYDSWHYHHQNQDFIALARACPETIFVIDHFGTPLGVGRFKDKREEVFSAWQKDMAELATCPNVYAKLGGLAMRDNGFYFHKQEAPPSSDALIEKQKNYYHHTIECFGANRCMFESNFPVDRLSLSYAIYWNAMKKIARAYSEEEKDALFYKTAARVYKL